MHRLRHENFVLHAGLVLIFCNAFQTDSFSTGTTMHAAPSTMLFWWQILILPNRLGHGAEHVDHSRVEEPCLIIRYVHAYQGVITGSDSPIASCHDETCSLAQLWFSRATYDRGYHGDHQGSNRAPRFSIVTRRMLCVALKAISGVRYLGSILGSWTPDAMEITIIPIYIFSA